MKDLSKKTRAELIADIENLQLQLKESEEKSIERASLNTDKNKPVNKENSPQKNNPAQEISLQGLQDTTKFSGFDNFEAALLSISVGVITTDKDGYITLMNHSAEKMTGWNRTDSIGRHVDDIFVIIDEHTRKIQTTSIIKALESGKVEDLLVYKNLLSKQGLIKTISDSAAPVRDNKGEISGGIIVFRDIARQKFAEERLRDSEESYRTLFEAANDAILISEDGIFIDCNQKASEFFNYSKEQIIGHSPAFLSPEYQADGTLSTDLAKQKNTLAISGKPLFFEWVLKRADGTLFDAEVGLNRIIVHGKQYLLSIIRDITERKNAENALKQSEEQFRTTFEKAPIGMCITGMDGVYIAVNRAFSNMVGYRKKDLTGVAFVDLTHPDDKVKSINWMNKLLEGVEAPRYLEKRYIHKNGQLKWVIISTSLIRETDGAFKYFVTHILDITEQKKSEIALKQSEQHFRLLFNTTSQAITLNEIILDDNNEPCDYRFIAGNPAYETYIGMKAKNFIGKRVRELYPNFDNRWIKIFGEVAITGKSKRLDFYSDELDKYFDFTIYSPKKGQFAVISFDITERLLEEKVRRLNEARLEALHTLNNMARRSVNEITDFALAEGVRLTGSNVGFLSFLDHDESIKTMHLWSNDVEQKSEFKDVNSEFNIGNHGPWCEAIRLKKAIIVNKNDIVNKQKNMFPKGHLLLNNYIQVPVFDGEKIVAIACVGNKEKDYDELDVKQLSLLMYGMWQLIQRKKNEELIAESEERYRLIADNSNDIITEFDKDGIIVFVSPACKKILGYETSEITGRSVFKFIHKDDMPELKVHQKVFLKTKKINLIKHRLRKKDGEYIWFETNSKVIIDNENKIGTVVSVCRDITEKIKSENLAREIGAAVFASKAKSEFLANMSHEIRNPLGAVIGLTNELTRSKLNTDQKEIVDSLRISAGNLLNIVNDILDFSKIEANKMDISNMNFEIEQVVRNSFSSLKTLADQKSLDFKYSIDKNLPPQLCGDSIKLQQIILNLASNAIKFTEIGKVSIDVKKSREKNGFVYLKVNISDTGIGIKTADFSRLFQSFTQLDSSTSKLYAGTGIGLAIVKGYTELMKGTVSFKSEYGRGTTFTVEIPFEKAKEVKKEKKKIVKIVDLSERKLKILIAEDDGINQFYLKKMFLNHGLNVDTAYNGLEVIEKFDKGHFDVILMDGQMPEMDGFEAARVIRTKEKKKKTHTPIIAITGYAIAGDKEKFIEAGMDDYITKPIDESQLMTIIRKLTGKRS